MPNRYSVRQRPIWAEDEPTWGESAQRGIEAGLATILKQREINRQEENDVLRQGGTIDPPVHRSIADRLRGILRRAPVGTGRTGIPDLDYGIAGQYPAGDGAERARRPTWDERVPPEWERAKLGGLGYPAEGSQPGHEESVTRSGRGIGPAIREQFSIQTPETQTYPTTYEQTLSSGRKAHIPIPGERERQIKAAMEAQDQKDYATALDPNASPADRAAAKSRLYARHIELAKESPEFAKPTGGQTQQEREAIEKLRHDYNMDEITARAGAESGQIKLRERLSGDRELAGIRERARLKVGEGDDGMTDRDRTSRANTLINNGRDLIESAKDRMTGRVKNQALYDRGIQMVTEGNKMLGIEYTDPGMTARRVSADPKTIQLRIQKLTADAKKQYPNASDAAIKRAVRNAMIDEGWPIR